MPGVQIPSRWVDNDLDEQATIVTTPKGYIDNITAQDFFDHFERLTRPQNISDLREIRRKATKKNTIILSWAKSGIYPLDPSVVINKMVNPLSSLSLEVAERDLPGYITPGLSSNHSSDFRDDSNEEEVGESSRDIHQNTHRNKGIPMMPSTPPTVIWNNINTPQLNLRQIKQYEGYMALPIESVISSGVSLTPSVLHVNEKVQKAHITLALNGITATQEIRCLKEKSLRCSERDE
ncbi:hypothetical protein FoTM2_017262 [Fusarium oxysporum f. sp. vasinfectum]|nr:hypothetical protein FoTM2_017262 [Fusarium oxysporum f. sp. vasinfectum]